MRQRLNILLACATLASLTPAWSCSNNTSGSESAPVSAGPYFSLTDYFNREADRLQQGNPEIVKTVSKNGEQETKNIRVSDWQREFALFIDADINKPAWRNSYRIDSAGTSITYTSTDSSLRTRRIRVEKSAEGTVKHIRVINRAHNMLYHTHEQLDYHADSLYRIVKNQDVRVIGQSHYTVTGRWHQ